MRMIVAVLSLVAIMSAAAQSAQNESQQGYRDCNLDRLDACQNSNQLFFGPFGKGPAKRKTQITAALNHFLQGAPKTYIGQWSFDVRDSAAEQFIGPSGAPEHLPGGDWLFAGFEPHASPYSAYVMFDKGGNILLVGTVDSAADAGGHRDKLEDYALRIYSRSGPPRPEIVAKWQAWARKAVGDQSVYPSVLPANHLLGTEVFIANGNRWSSHWLDR